MSVDLLFQVWSSIISTWELTRNANSQALPQPNYIKISGAGPGSRHSNKLRFEDHCSEAVVLGHRGTEYY